MLKSEYLVCSYHLACLRYHHIDQEEGELGEEERSPATVARIALYLSLIELEEEQRDEVGHRDSYYIYIGREPYEGGQRSDEADEEFPAAHRAVDGVALCLLRCPRVGQAVDDLARGSLRKGVGYEHRRPGCLEREAVEQGEVEGEVHHQPNHTETTYARVLHDREDAGAVVAPSSESIEAIGQPVFVQAAGQQEAGRHGQKQRHGGR